MKDECVCNRCVTPLLMEEAMDRYSGKISNDYEFFCLLTFHLCSFRQMRRGDTGPDSNKTLLVTDLKEITENIA